MGIHEWRWRPAGVKFQTYTTCPSQPKITDVKVSAVDDLVLRNTDSRGELLRHLWLISC